MILKNMTTLKNDRDTRIKLYKNFHLTFGVMKDFHTSIDKNSVSGWLSIFGYYIGYTK